MNTISFYEISKFIKSNTRCIEMFRKFAEDNSYLVQIYKAKCIEDFFDNVLNETFYSDLKKSGEGHIIYDLHQSSECGPEEKEWIISLDMLDIYMEDNNIDSVTIEIEE